VSLPSACYALSGRLRLFPWRDCILRGFSGSKAIKHASDFTNQAVKFVVWTSHLKETTAFEVSGMTCHLLCISWLWVTYYHAMWCIWTVL